MVSAASLSLRELAAALDGIVTGGEVLAPGPGHSASDRSLAVKPSPDAPDGFLIMSHAGDDWRDCRDHLRSRLGLPAWEPGDERHSQRTIPQRHIARWDFPAIDAEAQDRRRTEVELPAALAGTVLRYHARCPWRDENTGLTDRIPCLIVPFRSIDDDAITAIHRVRLDRPDLWPKAQRRMRGIVHRAAIKLGSPNGRLSIGEGLETCMAAGQLNEKQYGTLWAVGSVGMISYFPLIDGVTELVILAETGAASARAIRICTRRWKRTGRRVFVSRSPVGSDHNDYLMSLVQAGASRERA
jgi:hypothetical protein